MAKFYQSKDFLALHKAWETKLIESGFVDIEYKNSIAKNAAQSCQKMHEVQREAKYEYFQAINRCVHDDAEFMKPLDLTVMTLRGNGMLIGQIAIENKVNRKTVRYIIRRWEHKWGLRIWTLMQRKLTHEW